MSSKQDSCAIVSYKTCDMVMQAWEKWLRATMGKLRVDCLARRVCGAQDEYATLAAINEACAPNASTLSHLYSVYVHPSPSHKGYNKNSIFHGREVSPRRNVEWGSWSIVEVSTSQYFMALPGCLVCDSFAPLSYALTTLLS